MYRLLVKKARLKSASGFLVMAALTHKGCQFFHLRTGPNRSDARCGGSRVNYAYLGDQNELVVPHQRVADAVVLFVLFHHAELLAFSII